MEAAAPKTPKQILLEAAELIEQPGKWTQGAFARDHGGDGTAFCDPDAVCWCAEGAIAKVAGGCGTASSALAALGIVTGGIYSYNDAPGRMASEVASKMREAAEEALP